MYGSQQKPTTIEQKIQDLMAFKGRLKRDLSDLATYSGFINVFNKYRDEVDDTPDLILKVDYLREMDDAKKKILEDYITKADVKIKQLIKQLGKEPAA